MRFEQGYLLFFLLICSTAFGQATITIEVNWPSWSSDNRVTFRDPTDAQIGNRICNPATCFDSSLNNSYSTIGSPETYNSVPYGTGYDILLEDNWGDGWNGTGATVEVFQDGNSILTTTLASGSSTSISFNVTAPVGLDSDGDGVDNDVDLDDDNDGILDDIECPFNPIFSSNFTSASGTTVNQSFSTGVGFLRLDIYTLDNSLNLTINGVDIAGEMQFQLLAPGNFARFSDGFTYGENGVQPIWAMTGTVANPLLRLTVDSEGNFQLFGSRTSGGVLVPLTLDTNPSTVTWNTSGNNTLSINQILTGPTNINGLTEFSLECDADGDGIFNRLDTDSDNDTCNDADESYANANTDVDDNGQYGTGNPTVGPDGTVTGASYATPADGDTNSVFDFLETGAAPTISIQPINNQVCPGCTTSLSVTTGADAYQWQLFNGSIWEDLTNTGIHSGTSTSTLTITNPTPSDNGNQYRVVLNNFSFVCNSTISSSATMTVQVATVITNRRITYRVNKN